MSAANTGAAYASSSIHFVAELHPWTGVHTFGFDLAGNRTSVDATASTFGSANKLLTAGANTATHDADGNLTQVRQGGSSPLATFGWDDLGNCHQALKTDPPSGVEN